MTAPECRIPYSGCEIMFFTNKSAIWMGLSRRRTYEDVTVAELSGGTEPVEENTLQVTEGAVSEALGTGLFSARGSRRMGWAHQTYAEFLAARYLLQRDAEVKQIMSLLRHPTDPDGHLVPQLSQCAAWLAGMSPDVFREVMKTDPDVLLASDVSTASEEDRAKLVSALLTCLRRNRNGTKVI